MLAGAVTGALLLRHGLHWPIGFGAVLVALVLTLSWLAARATRGTPSTPKRRRLRTRS
jgi:hypothetical protein